MILTIETALRGVADMLRTRIIPAIDDKFAGETARLADLLLRLNADWVDEAAAIRVAENAAIRTLFREAATAFPGATLTSQLAEAAESTDPGLRISELDRESNRLRTLLADLHAHAEANNAAFAQRIWQFLETLETARAPR